MLPLPTENWGALVGEWCCHPDPFANKPLYPRENDCFIGDSFFLVNLRNDLWQPRPQLAPVETQSLSSENHFKLVKYLFRNDTNLEVSLELVSPIFSLSFFSPLEGLELSRRNQIKKIIQ